MSDLSDLRVATAWTLSVLYLPLRALVLGFHWLHELVWNADEQVGIWIRRVRG